MTNVLDNREELTKTDSKGVLSSLEEMGSQITQVWQQSRQLEFGADYREIECVVVAGMGGSAYGTHVVQTLFKDQLKVPVLVVPDYKLPVFVGSKTLVILSSYSGSSEETLSAAADALAKGAKITGLTAGGKLGEFLKVHNFPHLLMATDYNKGGVARFGYGYSIFGQIALFERLGLITLTEAEYKSVLDMVAACQLEWSGAVDSSKNLAKLTAFELSQRLPVYLGAEHLEGMLHVAASALNENSKVYSEYRVIPEMNHHLLEGLAFPQSNEANLIFLAVTSNLYEAGNRQRLELTTQLLEKFHLEYRSLTLRGTTKLTQAVELLMFGVYVSYYLAALYGKDPGTTPQVDWFKSNL